MRYILIFSIAMFVVFGTGRVIAVEDIEPFECPDDRAIRLIARVSSVNASDIGLKDRIPAYTYVIENASRSMDEAALRKACFGLAYAAYMVANPELGKGLHIGLFIPPKDAVESLLREHPILQHCPVRTLYSSHLPVMRVTYTPPEDAVKRGLTGWVDLKLDISDSGIVENAMVVDSSDSALEIGVVEHVLKFRYAKKSHYNGKHLPRNGLELRITTDYFTIARAKGCEWENP